VTRGKSKLYILDDRLTRAETWRRSGNAVNGGHFNRKEIKRESATKNTPYRGERQPFEKTGADRKSLTWG